MRNLLYLSLIICLAACASAPNSSAENRSTGAEREVSRDARDLTDYLSSVSGVSVRGNGASASIIIRGVKSISLSTEPLFILDGQVAGAGISSVYSAVNIQDVKRIRVLKKPAELARYGSRGANGVIEIETN